MLKFLKELFGKSDPPHVCDVPINKDLYRFGDEFVCPHCRKVWTLTIDESGECCSYWDSY